ncbi:hypothetical protein CDS [Bradyrhizobium sp.]|nr:hypothetical protein CDS [Bradyrhizobium sp.]
MILIEAMLLVAERARQRLANERVFGLEVRRECALGQAGLAHDPSDPGGGDTVSAHALRRHIDDVPSRRCLMTFLETHLFSSSPISRSR